MAKAPVIVTAIEIGTSQINVLVGAVTKDSVSVVGRGSAPAADAVIKGDIRNMEAAGKALDQALSQADDSCGNMLLRSQIVTLLVSGGGVICTRGIGTAAIRNAGGVVGEYEMREARENAQVVEVLNDWKIINSDDICWRLDGRMVGNPYNQRGRKLEVEALIVQGHIPRLDNFVNLVRSSELENAKLYPVYSPICAKEGVATERELVDGALLIDLGAGCADYLTAHAGGILEAGTLQIGFDHVANDLAIGLGLPFAACRKLFENGTLKSALEQNLSVLNVAGAMGTRQIPMSQIETIVDARLREIFEEIRKKVPSPSGQVNGILTGGGALYPPALEMFTKVFGIPCRVGTVADASGSVTNLNSPRYSAIWGALKVAASYHRSFIGSCPAGVFENMIEGMNNIGLYLPRLIDKLWKAFKF